MMTFSDLCAAGAPAIFTAQYHGTTVYRLYQEYDQETQLTTFSGGAGGRLYRDFGPDELVTRLATDDVITA